ncbi:protein-L-isoaspartate O-methyltransferase family protein [Kitasatospora sp. LaBMicrA B282]|uniref:protein-L-isoaspartate O-methyltransferase family protein n=1 Tax=Kitasatospora sp. LaBMicrA B282 TaxID=3420949 RepID=UPI003D0FEF15
MTEKGSTSTPFAAEAHARSVFAAGLAREPGVHDRAVVQAMARVPRHQLMPRLFAPLGDARPARCWRLLDFADEPAQHLAVCYGWDQVVVQLDGRPTGPLAAGREYTGVPSGQSSGAGLLAVTLQDLRLAPGDRCVELGACTGYLSAVAADLTGRQATGVEIDRELARDAAQRLAAIGADVRLVVRDGLRGLPEGPWDAIAGSFAVRHIPASWLHRLAPGGRLRTTITTGAPGWHATALVHRDEHGALTGRLAAERWGHVPDRAGGWIPLPQPPAGSGRSRSAVLAPPEPAERGLWVALAHSLPGVRRHWSAPGFDDEVVLVAPDGSRAAIARDGSRSVEWGPRSLWAEAEELHARWTGAGGPAEYRLEFTGPVQRVVGGPGLSWELPIG